VQLDHTRRLLPAAHRPQPAGNDGGNASVAVELLVRDAGFVDARAECSCPR
jgi:hypothetical protein